MEFEKLSEHLEENLQPQRLPQYESTDELKNRVIQKKIRAQNRRMLQNRKGWKNKLWYFLLTPILDPYAKDYYFYCVELRAILISGIPFSNAMTIMAESASHRKLQRQSLFVHNELEKGLTPEVIFKNKKLEFPIFFTNLLLTGLKTGTVANNLQLLADHYAYIGELRSHIFKVIWYPIFQIIACALILAAKDIIILYIRNDKVFKFLPSLLIFWRYISMVILGFIMGWGMAKMAKWPKARPSVDIFITSFPLLGSYFRKYKLAIFFRVFGNVVSAGAGLLHGFRNAIEAMDNFYLQRMILRAERFLRDGESIHTAFKVTGAFKPLELAMITTAEASGSYYEVLKRLSDYYFSNVKINMPTIIFFASAFLPFMVLVIFATSLIGSPFLIAFGIAFMVFFYFMTI